MYHFVAYDVVEIMFFFYGNMSSAMNSPNAPRVVEGREQARRRELHVDLLNKTRETMYSRRTHIPLVTSSLSTSPVYIWLPRDLENQVEICCASNMPRNHEARREWSTPERVRSNREELQQEVPCLGSSRNRDSAAKSCGGRGITNVGCELRNYYNCVNTRGYNPRTLARNAS